jgi:recombination associated protein RdgC
VLTDALALKKIKLLDVVLESGKADDQADDGFDADVAISTGELQPLLVDLITALGGPLTQDACAPVATAAPAANDVAPWGGIAA